jgi:hypothetical protein
MEHRKLIALESESQATLIGGQPTFREFCTLSELQHKQRLLSFHNVSFPREIDGRIFL